MTLLDIDTIFRRMTKKSDDVQLPFRKPTRSEIIQMANVLNHSISLLQGSCAAARALNVSAQAVSQWERCPPHRCIQLEHATCRRVTRYQLRPDIFGDGSDV